MEYVLLLKTLKGKDEMKPVIIGIVAKLHWCSWSWTLHDELI